MLTQAIGDRGPLEVPCVLVRGHAPFCGKDAAAAVGNAVMLEQVARMALLTTTLAPDAAFSDAVRDKHFQRKHGSRAYYGQ